MNPKTRIRFVYIILLIIIIVIVIKGTKNFIENKSVHDNTQVVLNEDITIYLKKYVEADSSKYRSQLNYISALKNNFIHDYLKNAEEEIYLSNNLENTIEIVIDSGGEYNYKNSQEISGMDKEFSSNLVDNVAQYLLSIKKYKATLRVSLPIATSEVPAPIGFHYGNDVDGIIPDKINLPNMKN